MVHVHILTHLPIALTCEILICCRMSVYCWKQAMRDCRRFSWRLKDPSVVTVQDIRCSTCQCESGRELQNLRRRAMYSSIRIFNNKFISFTSLLLCDQVSWAKTIHIGQCSYVQATTKHTHVHTYDVLYMYSGTYTLHTVHTYVCVQCVPQNNKHTQRSWLAKHVHTVAARMYIQSTIDSNYRLTSVQRDSL